MNPLRITLGTLALLSTGLAGFAAGTRASAAQAAELGEEHRWLASLAGEYSAEMDGVLGASSGTSRVESVLGGLWSIRHLESTVMGQPYSGMEIVGFDPLKKKFVSLWIDSMTPLFQLSEGTYDAESKTLTLEGPSRGMDGEVATMTNTTVYRDGGMRYEMIIEGASIVTVDYSN